MFKRLAILMVLGILLSAAFAGTAQAGLTINSSFTMEPDSTKINVGETVMFTDHTVNPCDCALLYYWWVRQEPYGAAEVIEAGNPACLNLGCTQIKKTFSTPGSYSVMEAASTLSPLVSAIGEANRSFRVVDPSLPPIFTLNGPKTIGLPAIVEVLSQAQGVSITSCEMLVSKNQACKPYLLSRTGPDSQGLYHFRFKIPVGQPGMIGITFQSNVETPNGNVETLTFNVTSSKEHFGDVRSCYRKGYYVLSYYDTTSSKVLLTLQAQRAKRWVTLKHESFNMVVPGPEFSWMQRLAEVSFGSTKTTGSKRRVIYEIRKGHKLLKEGRMLKQPCQKE